MSHNKRFEKSQEARDKKGSEMRIWLAEYLNKNLGCKIDIESVR